MIFTDACFGKDTPYTPVWLMRQAGRYLPEYMKVRQKAGNFLSLCKTPELAAEVTIQPVDILGVDAAILFSDILVVPLEMGMELRFIKGEGPWFPKPIECDNDLSALDINRAYENLEYVYETIKIVRSHLSSKSALIGFCGAPWTLATYIIEGGGTKTYSKVKKLLYTNPQFLHAILYKVTETLKLYMEEQIKSGVNAVQIFDSWASALEENAFFEFSWKYIKELCTYLKSKYPHIPIIVFPKGISGYLDKIDGDFDVFGTDWSTPIELAKDKLGYKYVLQGNMEPTRLYDKNAIKNGVEHIIKVMGAKRHIFNLGHGILPDIPVQNAKYFIDLVHSLTKK
ncbi:MAG: uroporphyrinogen decarboxylase [Campylobacteraceae bacterium]|jgi:uroporphyrinogen decarboxylase|nr:uroporphyrinogen decarboxylase [Campylobacteraceae bacterium]